MNAGIAAVIPAKEIADFLMNDERIIKLRDKGPRPPKPPVPDSKILPEESFTREDFEAALKKASKKLRTEK